MKGILKTVISVLLLLCLAFSIVGCGEETGNDTSMPYIVPGKEIPFTQGEIGGTLKANEINLYEDALEIIQTKEDLVNVFSEIEIVWENQPIWERYDEDFFETKSLIFVVQIVSGSTVERKVQHIGLKDNEITMYIRSYHGCIVDCAMTVFYDLLEVNKIDIVDVSTLKTEYIN